MAEQPLLAIDKYNHGDDFDQWVIRFEMAVGLAYTVNEPAKIDKKKQLCMEWLPLMIDDATWNTYSGITAATWEKTKQQMSQLLVDPMEKYDYFAGRNQIVWDGEESFQFLVSRIKAKVDKYYEETARRREYFQRFRSALSKYPEYLKVIDIGCGDNWDVEEAKKIAGRLRIAEGDRAAPAAPNAVPLTEAMSGDRASSIEDTLHGMSIDDDDERDRRPRHSEDRYDRDHYGKDYGDGPGRHRCDEEVDYEYGRREYRREDRFEENHVLSNPRYDRHRETDREYSPDRDHGGRRHAREGHPVYDDHHRNSTSSDEEEQRNRDRYGSATIPRQSSTRAQPSSDIDYDALAADIIRRMPERFRKK